MHNILDKKDVINVTTTNQLKAIQNPDIRISDKNTPMNLKKKINQ